MLLGTEILAHIYLVNPVFPDVARNMGLCVQCYHSALAVVREFFPFKEIPRCNNNLMEIMKGLLTELIPFIVSSHQAAHLKSYKGVPEVWLSQFVLHS